MKTGRLFNKSSLAQTKKSDLTIRERFAALGNLPLFFRMIWETSAALTLLSFLLRVLRSFSPLAILYVGKLIIDEVILQHSKPHSADLSRIWELVAAEFALAVISELLNRSIVLTDSLLGDLFSRKTSVQIMEHAATLDLDQFEDAVFYDKLERARQQTIGRTILLSQVMSQLQDLITVGFLAAGLVVFSPWLILLLFLAILPSFLGESYFNDQSYALTRRQTPEKRELDYLRYLGASDETAKELKIFNLSAFVISRFSALSAQFFTSNKKLAIARSGWGSLFSMIGTAGYYGAYLLIITEAVSGKVTIGELTFLAGSFRQVRALLESILNRFTAVSQGAVYLRDFFEFFQIEPKIVTAGDPLPFPEPIRQGFVFENVGFKYAHAEKWATRHLNFTLHPGEKLALVGENGAGKTTLVKLLARLYDPTEGRILLDGIELKAYDLTSLRKHMGIIFQDFIRYQMSFAQNIAVGNIPELDNRPLIERAAQESLADELASRLPEHYEQMLGKMFSGGVELSGGEWQKVALARAYMKASSLLILDEPTAALDARAEYEVFQRFAELTAGKSAVLISHRFSTVRMADRILVLEKGRLLETGSHEELMRRNGKYAELFNLQAMGYK